MNLNPYANLPGGRPRRWDLRYARRCVPYEPNDMLRFLGDFDPLKELFVNERHILEPARRLMHQALKLASALRL